MSRRQQIFNQLGFLHPLVRDTATNLVVLGENTTTSINSLQNQINNISGATGTISNVSTSEGVTGNGATANPIRLHTVESCSLSATPSTLTNGVIRNKILVADITENNAPSNLVISQCDSGYGFVIGGTGNTAPNDGTLNCSAILSGNDNVLSAPLNRSVIAGGSENYISGSNNFIGAGLNNTITSNSNSFIGAGSSGNIFASDAVILGGFRNTISEGANYTAIITGLNNVISGGNYSTIIGGTDNEITESALYSSIASGSNCNIRGTSNQCFIAGANSNTIEGNSTYSSAISGEANLLSGGRHSFMIGGNTNSLRGSNSIIDCSGTIGGKFNTIGDNTSAGVSGAIMVGGFSNAISAGTSGAVCISGAGNTLSASQSVIIGCTGQTLTQNNTTMVNRLRQLGGSQKAMKYYNNVDDLTLTFDDHYIYYESAIARNIFFPSATAPINGQEYYIITGAVGATCTLSGTPYLIRSLLTNGDTSSVDIGAYSTFHYVYSSEISRWVEIDNRSFAL